MAAALERTFLKKYKLPGRILLNNPFTDSLSNTAGRIFLNITVDAYGNVIDATGPARGSTSTDTVLLKKATDAAYTAKFNRVDSIAVQKGTITFRYFAK